jgi:hypothetical protein
MSSEKPGSTKSTKAAKQPAKKSAQKVAAEPERTASIASLSVSQLTQLIAAEVAKAVGGLSTSKPAVHVNSGPPGFVNGGGHANFDPGGRLGSHVNSGPPGFVNGGGHANFDPAAGARAHVNSGPPGFVNGGGHANFDPGGRLGSHVNSGPPGFVNGGGHANFDPRIQGDRFTLVSLPDGSAVHIPATGPVNIIVRGFKITR